MTMLNRCQKAGSNTGGTILTSFEGLHYSEQQCFEVLRVAVLFDILGGIEPGSSFLSGGRLGHIRAEDPRRCQRAEQNCHPPGCCRCNRCSYVGVHGTVCTGGVPTWVYYPGCTRMVYMPSLLPVVHSPGSLLYATFSLFRAQGGSLCHILSLLLWVSGRVF